MELNIERVERFQANIAELQRSEKESIWSISIGGFGKLITGSERDRKKLNNIAKEKL